MHIGVDAATARGTCWASAMTSSVTVNAAPLLGPRPVRRTKLSPPQPPPNAAVLALEHPAHSCATTIVRCVRQSPRPKPNSNYLSTAPLCSRGVQHALLPLREARSRLCGYAARLQLSGSPLLKPRRRRCQRKRRAQAGGTVMFGWNGTTTERRIRLTCHTEWTDRSGWGISITGGLGY